MASTLLDHGAPTAAGFADFGGGGAGHALHSLLELAPKNGRKKEWGEIGVRLAASPEICIDQRAPGVGDAFSLALSRGFPEVAAAILSRGDAAALLGVDAVLKAARAGEGEVFKQAVRVLGGGGGNGEMRVALGRHGGILKALVELIEVCVRLLVFVCVCLCVRACVCTDSPLPSCHVFRFATVDRTQHTTHNNQHARQDHDKTLPPATYNHPCLVHRSRLTLHALIHHTAGALGRSTMPSKRSTLRASTEHTALALECQAMLECGTRG